MRLSILWVNLWTRAGAKRTLPLTPKALAIIEDYRGRNNTYIFLPHSGMDNKNAEEIEHKSSIANNTVNRALRNTCQKADIEKWVNMHMAKHSFADFAFKNDTGLLLISKRLGHTKLSTTQHYLKDFYHKKEAEEVNRLFG